MRPVRRHVKYGRDMQEIRTLTREVRLLDACSSVQSTNRRPEAADLQEETDASGPRGFEHHLAARVEAT